MTYRRLGNTGMDVSLLSFGSHTDPADRIPVRLGKTTLTAKGQAKRDRIIAAAFDRGVNLMDVYESEGQWEPAARIVKGRRDKVLVSLAHEITPGDIDAACGQLRLKTERELSRRIRGRDCSTACRPCGSFCLRPSRRTWD